MWPVHSCFKLYSTVYPRSTPKSNVFCDQSLPGNYGTSLLPIDNENTQFRSKERARGAGAAIGTLYSLCYKMAVPLWGNPKVVLSNKAIMSVEKTEVETFFGRCRCCLAYGYLKNMWVEHQFEGEAEVYGEMLVQCFALTVSFLSWGLIMSLFAQYSCFTTLFQTWYFEKISRRRF